MRRVLHLALHDTRLFVLARESLFFMFAMPVLFMLFFASVFGGGGPRSILVALPVVNDDTGWLGSAFVRQLEGEHFEVKILTAAAADSAQPPRLVRVPADFTARILAGDQVSLRVEKAARSDAEFDLAADVRLNRAQVGFLGNLIRWDGARASGGAMGTEIDPSARERLLALIAEPARVTVKSGVAGRGRPVPSGAGQSIPGMLAMFVVMTTLIGGAESLTREKHAGTLARLATTPFSRGEILGGKLLHLTLVAIIQALVLMAAGEAIGRFHVFGISFSWGADWLAVVLLLLPYGFAVGCLTLFVSGLFRTTQQAESLGWLAGMVMAALGGCWWPIEIMPPAVRAIAHAFPTFWAMQGLHGVITFGHGPLAVVRPAAILVLFGIGFGLLGRRTMRLS
jgi:ABC-2 type transport system permease protein